MDSFQPSNDYSDMLCKMIMSCSSHEITDIMDAAVERMHQLFPSNEVVYLILPCDNEEERNRIIDSASSMMKRFKRNSDTK